MYTPCGLYKLCYILIYIVCTTLNEWFLLAIYSLDCIPYQLCTMQVRTCLSWNVGRINTESNVWMINPTGERWFYVEVLNYSTYRQCSAAILVLKKDDSFHCIAMLTRCPLSLQTLLCYWCFAIILQKWEETGNNAGAPDAHFCQ